MRVAIVTAMWQRPDVFDIFGRNTLKLVHECKQLEINVFVAGSEGDVSRNLAESFGFEYVETPNAPLFNKWNVAVQLAREWEPDYVLMMGSDDVMSAAMLRRYFAPMRSRFDLIGSLDWFFYDLPSGRAVHWRGYTGDRRGKLCGAGRMLSRSLLDRLEWQPWQAQVDGEGMDGTMMKRLAQVGLYTNKAIQTNGELAVDIKSEVSITPFALWRNSWEIDPTRIRTEMIQ